VVHISDAEAASNFGSLLERVRAGEEVVIEHDARPVAVLRPAESDPGRLLSESIALAEAHARESGCEPTLDSTFAADLEEIIRGRRPRNLPAWD
jgi:prevent-host-death family protein